MADWRICTAGGEIERFWPFPLNAATSKSVRRATGELGRSFRLKAKSTEMWRKLGGNE